MDVNEMLFETRDRMHELLETSEDFDHGKFKELKEDGKWGLVAEMLDVYVTEFAYTALKFISSFYNLDLHMVKTGDAPAEWRPEASEGSHKAAGKLLTGSSAGS